MVPSWFSKTTSVPGTARDAAIDFDMSRALAAHSAARRVLAGALAAQRRDADRKERLASRARDLETRAVAALRGGREDLAVQASEAIASIEGELQASNAMATEHAAAVATLRRTVEDQRRRLADLDRGRRLAAVQGALIDSRGLLSDSGDPLTRAEAALADLSGERRAMLEISTAADDGAASLVDAMAEAGFGAPCRPTARDVLARIRASAVEAEEVEPPPFDRLGAPSAPAI